MEIKELLQLTVEKNASDLHLAVGQPPILRINGRLVQTDGPVLTQEKVKALILSLMNPMQKDQFLVNKELDFSSELAGQGRFRINAYHARGQMAAALRLLPMKIKTIGELNLLPICHQFVKLQQGLILVTGPTGHGKSTSLAAMIDEINRTRAVHIVTIEDPIEYVYEKYKGIVSQREMKQDTHSWQIALRSVLREDPDVVLVGEMRDYETIAAAITVAETGHLVFATLHTNSASQTVDRIVDVFPEHQQGQIRVQLGVILEAVISQRLIPALKGGRVPACEVLLGTAAVKTAIRESKTHMIDNIIQTSGEIGMLSLEMDLARLVKAKQISPDEARRFSLRPGELDRLLRKL
ncbi:PilT/PilU family type 4a pilus ATPase [Patescibacteria group bacterium]|nr:PilT/PilU family type 4a pilus ATPase [Patescibacteria group bacterium]MBU1931709.1 PilT/PilU family type 4a pilus ATPase [Patescibacteria group bacterium]